MANWRCVGCLVSRLCRGPNKGRRFRDKRLIPPRRSAFVGESILLGQPFENAAGEIITVPKHERRPRVSAEEMQKPFALPSTRVIQALGSDAVSGLTPDECAKRLEQFGPNQLAEPPRPTFFAKLLEQISDFLVLILIGAAAVSALLGEWVDCVVIIAIVVVNATIGLIQEAKAEQALESLKKMAAPTAHVIRAGDYVTIPARELVPGDIVLIHAGDKLSADMRLIEAQNLQVDEAPLTGESVPVEKDASLVFDPDTALADRRNMVFFGTTATYGRGKGIVVATGMKTEIGKIAGALGAIPPEKTPLQQNLTVLGKTLGTAIMAICGVVFVLGLLRREPPFEMFLTSVSLAVAAIPEGLPAVVTIVLAIGVKRMASRNAIMRKLAAVETLGCTTVICSDKTGTLTQNQMTIVNAYSAGRLYQVTGQGYAPHGRFIPVDRDAVGLGLGTDGALADETSVASPETPALAVAGRKGPEAEFGSSIPPEHLPLALLLVGGALNNDAALKARTEGNSSATRWEIVGDPTEGALVVAAAKAGFAKADLESRFPRVAEIPFDSSRKRMTTIHQLADGKYLAWVKGAPEVVLSLCGHALLPNGSAPPASPGAGSPQEDPGLGAALLALESSYYRVPLDEGLRQDYATINQRMAENALRVIAVAYRFLDELPDKPNPEQTERDLTVVGLVGMIDPPRPEVPPAVEKCKRAGIIPVMITGDHHATATAIARSLGMLKPEHRSMTGRDLDAISEAELERVAEEARVYARVSPEHKMKIVDALKKRGHVVAMTGDGVNDAPALKRADIGVAMGITGTDVAKETSDMILADDNFSTIVAAVEEGRIIYSNIAKFVLYLLSCNMGEILTIFSSMMANLPLPLRPVQLLWLNLVTDSLPALALGIEKGDADIMDRPPRDPKEPILTRERWFAIGVQAVLIAATTLGAFLYGLSRTPLHLADSAVDPIAYARTMAFAALVTSELLRAFTARSEVDSLLKIGPFTNLPMVGANLLSFLLLLAVIEIPPLRPIFYTAALGVSDWLVVLAFAVIPGLGAEVMKAFKRRRRAR